LIQHAGPHAWAYHTHFAEVLGKGLTDSADEIKQASAFAVGLAAQEGGSEFYPMCVQAIPLLVGIIQADPQRNPDSVLATENAIAALGRILRFLGDKGVFDFGATLAVWVRSLPILNDQEEVGHTYEYLLSLLESQNPIVIGENQSNFPKLISILTDLLASDLDLEDPLKNRVLGALQVLMQSITEAQKNEIWNAMSQGKRQILKTRLGLA
ncbi:Importin-5, partial [Dinochytrium kinnereticum]